ncbi:MAG TPA: hypothetical protein VKZ87_08625 [Ferrovibrio sp.]|uniref:hypothetical protein n=1 Tax=Ferrovibrio sp. TaxID=1917215 RepID=UPI002B4B867D|nr:hypothetical protein [Ferrovibrio sp.]HLT77437.1 hypothetical protein [Ferrovibrio sp.]
MSQTDWLQLIALLMMGALILPAVLRLPWANPRILLFIAAWLGIFLVVSLVIRFAG